jgi:hypothetical protein
VNDYWMCEHCKSLNRAGTGKCYSCHRKYGSAPKQAGVIRRAAEPQSSTSGGRPIPGAPPPAGFFTGSSVGQGVVGPGGVPVNSDTDLPAYLSRPIAGSALTSTSYLEAQAASSRGSPIAAVKRRVSNWVASRQSVSVWIIGYLSAGLITLLLVVGALTLTTLNSAIRVALQTTSVTEAWDELGPGLQSAVTMMGAAFAIIALLALSSFSIFIGLSTHNAAGMRTGDLWLTPGQAATCWWKTVWAQIKLVAGFLIPGGLLIAGYHLAGLIAALIAVEIAQRSLNDPFGWISNPARHLSDLYARLGDAGSEGSLLGSTWKTCFQFANGLSIVAYALPVIGISIVAAAAVACSRSRSSGWGRSSWASWWWGCRFCWPSQPRWPCWCRSRSTSSSGRGAGARWPGPSSRGRGPSRPGRATPADVMRRASATSSPSPRAGTATRRGKGAMRAASSSVAAARAAATTTASSSVAAARAAATVRTAATRPARAAATTTVASAPVTATGDSATIRAGTRAASSLFPPPATQPYSGRTRPELAVAEPDCPFHARTALSNASGAPALARGHIGSLARPDQAQPACRRSFATVPWASHFCPTSP